MEDQRTPLSGEVWDAFLDPVIGREQAGRRPVLVVSGNWFNEARRQLVLMVPITGTEPHVRYQIEIAVGEGGLTKSSTILPEQIRSIDISRLKKYRGVVSKETLAEARQMIAELLLD